MALAAQVKLYVDHLKKMRPDPAAVRRAAGKWYDAAASTGDSINILRSAFIDLGVYWEGDAYDRFKEYMDTEVVSTAEKNEAALRNIGDALIGVHNKVAEKYREGLTQLAETTEKAIQYHKDWGTLEGDAKNVAWHALHDLITLWIAGMILRRADVQQIVNDGAGEMAKLRGQMKSLKAPYAVPPGVLDKGKWEYDP